MNTRRFSGFLFALLIIGSFAGSLPAAAQEIDSQDYWTVAEVRGQVSARKGGNAWNESEQVAAGQKIGPYSTLEAGTDGEAILVRGGDRMTVYANTQIELPPMDRSSGITRIFQRAAKRFSAFANAASATSRLKRPTWLPACAARLLASRPRMRQASCTWSRARLPSVPPTVRN